MIMMMMMIIINILLLLKNLKTFNCRGVKFTKLQNVKKENKKKIVNVTYINEEETTIVKIIPLSLSCNISILLDNYAKKKLQIIQFIFCNILYLIFMTYIVVLCK